MAETGEILAVLAVLAVLAAVRVWNYKGPARLQPLVNPIAAAVLILMSGPAGYLKTTKTAWLYAVTGAVVIAVILAVAARFAGPERTDAHPVRKALLEIPFAVVVFEETAFRGVLTALVGPYLSALAFGLWHVRSGKWAVLFTAGAGLILGWGGAASGSLLVPFAWHWAANGFGVLLFQAPKP
ncbi:CPBP family intramembrane glutamic endopeptidase [Actinoplanes sp. NPDC049596]|uniref:CPBP family intramembrane glutamic endopeptidase n=1 Tax=unclassified Actinoplanes TaxID=2626549 RepID=UPI00342BC449